MIDDARDRHGDVGDGDDDVGGTLVELTAAVRNVVDPVTTVRRPIQYGPIEIKNHLFNFMVNF